MTKTVIRFLLAPGLALALTSCDVFRPDAPQPGANNQAYGAAGAYDNTAGGYPAYQQPQTPANPYAGGTGAAGGYGQPNYTTPNYNTPYTQPADNPYATGGGAYSTGGGAGSGSGRSHTVASGENLSKIAQRYGTTTSAIMRANNITNPDFVRAGQKLTIP